MKKSNIMCSLMCIPIDTCINLQNEINFEASFDSDNQEYELVRVEKNCWELEEVLSLLFEETRSINSKLKSLVENNKVRVYLDICVVHYGKYPALLFEGDIMAKIRELKADISIDVY